jgi:integrase
MIETPYLPKDHMKIATFVGEVFPHLPITKKTLGNYMSAYRNNLHPFIGEKDLSQVTTRDLVDAMAPLPSQTRYQTYMVARVIFREAMLRSRVEVSPLQGVSAPRTQVQPQDFLTWSELSAIDFGRHNTHIRFLALHGLRWGEAAALTEVDIHGGFIHVTKSIHGATKTPSGVRKVPLISEFQEFPLWQKYIARALKPHNVTVHSLRKTYAYNLKEAGVHVTTAAKLMGHSNPMVTLKIYTQVRDSEIMESGSKITDFINQLKISA